MPAGSPPVRHRQMASMKVPPKRKGNGSVLYAGAHPLLASMKVPLKRKGNGHTGGVITSRCGGTSMKVYTSRYRTSCPAVILREILICLIESPTKR